MVSEGIRITDVSHYCCGVRVTGNRHDLVQARMMNCRAGNEACSQRMPCYVLSVQAYAGSVVLEDTRDIAVVHWFTTQVPSALHRLKHRALGYA